MLQAFRKMVQVDESGIDLQKAKKLSKEVLPQIRAPHALYRHQASLNPKKMKKLMTIEDIIDLKPNPKPERTEEPCMALVPVSAEKQISASESVQHLAIEPDIGSSFALEKFSGLKSVQNQLSGCRINSGLFSLKEDSHQEPYQHTQDHRKTNQHSDMLVYEAEPKQSMMR